MPIKTLLMLALLGIGYLIIAAYRKVDSKVNEYKLTRTPDDIDTLEKLLFRYLREKKLTEAFDVCNNLLEVDSTHLLAQIYQANMYHEAEEYSNSGPILKSIAPQLSENNAVVKLRNKAFSLTDSDRMDNVELLTAKAFYYCGHIYSMENEVEEAAKWKKLAKKYNSSLLNMNLY